MEHLRIGGYQWVDAERYLIVQKHGLEVHSKCFDGGFCRSIFTLDEALAEVASHPVYFATRMIVKVDCILPFPIPHESTSYP